MCLVGNDIVDLRDFRARKKSKDNRFVQRVFLPAEQSMIFAFVSPDTMLWALWAAKETAYKAVSKANHGITSAPSRYEVKIRPKNFSCSGHVLTPRGKVFIKIIIAKNHVHCVGVTDGSAHLEKTIHGTGKIPPCHKSDASAVESAFVRKIAAKAMGVHLGLDPDCIRIIRFKTRNGLGPPKVYINGEKTRIDLSMSHDHGFAAYAFTSG